MTSPSPAPGPAARDARFATSAGLLMFRRAGDGAGLECLLVHPGGPYWARKDEGAWSIPKGEYDPAGETPEAAARREFAEETGFAFEGSLIDLGETRLKSGKRVRAFAVEGDCDPALLVSDTFEIEWPPRSGRRRSFPEADRAAWFGRDEAMRRIHEAQRVFIERLFAHLA